MFNTRGRWGIGVIFAGCVVFLLPQLHAARKPPTVVVKQGYAMVPLSYYRDENLLLVDVQINGRPATMLLDTGSPTNIVALDRGLHFALRPDYVEAGPHQGERVVLANGMRAFLCKADDFSIGPVHSHGLRVVEMDVVTTRFRTGELRGMAIDGILGAAFLMEHNAVIDVQRHELFLRVDPKAPDVFAATLPQNGWSAVPIRVAATKLFVAGKVEGVAAPLILDTGAPYTGLSSAFCAKAGVKSGFFTFRGGVIGYGGDREVKAKVKELRVGSYAVQNQELAVSPSFDRAFKQEQRNDQPLVGGLLGVDFLGNNLAFIDYGNKTLYLKRP